MNSHLHHPTYKFVSEQDADAIVWAFIDSDTMKRVPIKFPELKPHEARAKVTYTGLCLTDHHKVKGELGPCPYPIVTGHEIVGIITHIGSDVKNVKVGDKVGFGPFRECCEKCEPCKLSHEQLCVGPLEQKETYGPKYWGGYASHLQQPADFFFQLPAGISEDRAPPLFCAGTTTYVPIAKYAKPGQDVAVLGIGGLGHLAVQYAKAWGCDVTAFTSSKDKEPFIKQLGADKVVVVNEETLREEAGKYHLVLSTLPADTKLTAYVALTKILGTFCQLGATDVNNPPPFNPNILIVGNINFVGSYCGSRKETKETLEFSVKHNIVPLCEQFSFEEFPKAYDRLVNGKPIFRCVVDATNVSIGN